MHYVKALSIRKPWMLKTFFVRMCFPIPDNKKNNEMEN